MKNPIAHILLENGQELTAELYPDKAPETVANFIKLANERQLYNGLLFHRVIPGFMVQGGDPQGTGMGGPGHTIKGEFAANGFAQNNLPHQPGTLSMARAQHPNSGGSQFFICVADCAFLNGNYAAFGKLTAGLEAAVALSQVQRDANDRPLTPQRMAKVWVETQTDKETAN